MDGESRRLGGDLPEAWDGMNGRPTQGDGVLRRFRKLYSAASREARLVENDRAAQKHYSKLYGSWEVPDP